MIKDPMVGIDLGTTNSEVAILRDGEIVVLEENGTAIFPSCVGLDAQGQLLVGQPARNQYALRPQATIRSIKRKMGTGQTVTLGAAVYTPPEISAMILTALKQRAERALGQPVRRAVITVPAYFTDAQRQATREAGELAGFAVERLLNEPTAAAFAYELGKDFKKKKTILVYDLGGGTFDVSILRMEGELVEVLATHGNTQLGGDDIDQLILDMALKVFNEKHPGAELSETGRARLLIDCEQLKIALSGLASATLSNLALPLTGQAPVPFEWNVTRAEFENWTGNLHEGTLESVHAALHAAQLGAKDLDEVILVGGCTRTPCVADLLERELAIRPRVDVHPDLAVAYGAGVMAARLMGESRHRILVDITSHTFGISTVYQMDDGRLNYDYYSPLIKAGTPLPCSRGRSYYTHAPGQDAVKVEVFQGDSPYASKNTLVGHFRVEGLDQKAPASSEVLVNMKLDLDGILTITAIEKHTGLNKTVVMKDTMVHGVEAQKTEISEKMASLLGVQPDSPPLGADASPPPTDAASEELLEIERRIERCRGRMDETDRAEIEQHKEKLAGARRNGDEVGAATAIKAIEDILFYLESER